MFIPKHSLPASQAVIKCVTNSHALSPYDPLKEIWLTPLHFQMRDREGKQLAQYLPAGRQQSWIQTQEGLAKLKQWLGRQCPQPLCWLPVPLRVTLSLVKIPR